MILATSDHFAHSDTISDDDATMLDIDLSILGAPLDEYQRYARAIHDEYVPAATTDQRFRVGRLEFLRRVVSRPHIFLTPDARRRWDDVARANMRWEIEELAKQQGVLERWVSAARKS
jgi:predicted metal-dependent HD superfamily phosphohydrolase